MPSRDPVLRRRLRHREVADDVWFLLAQSLSTYVGCEVEPRKWCDRLWKLDRCADLSQPNARIASLIEINLREFRQRARRKRGQYRRTLTIPGAQLRQQYRAHNCGASPSSDIWSGSTTRSLRSGRWRLFCSIRCNERQLESHLLRLSGALKIAGSMAPLPAKSGYEAST